MTFWWRPGRQDLAARVLLTIGALLPYWRLLSFAVVYVTDDYFASDIYNGELPGRVLVGNLVRRGEVPVWTSQLCSGLPLAGSSADPIGLGAFALLPPAAALDLFVIVLLLVAAHGTYGLARRFGADRIGAVLAGLAFAGSGYIACQLKHLAIVSTVVWLPVGLLLIDRVLSASVPPKERAGGRALAMAAFGLVFAQQVLSGFPQSAYICALTYGTFALFRALQGRSQFASPRTWMVLLAGLGIAVGLGAAAGAFVLLPMSALGSISDRAATLGYEWSTRLAYWPSNILTFVVPYINGDISDNTYKGPPFFWEDYGYVGAATFLLAIYGGVRARRQPIVMFLIVMTVLAYLFVLGAATPVYKIAYLLIPGLKMFRFPTRFLIVVELGLAVLAAIGVTRLRDDLQRRLGSARAPLWIATALCVFTAVDLWYHQPRQNPMVPAAAWLAPPASVQMIRADTQQPRTFTPRQRDLHRGAFLAARGWADVGPYFDLRGLLQPNIGAGFWGVPSADCYAGIAPRWYTDVWGDHNREDSLAFRMSLADTTRQALLLHPAMASILKGYGVTHVLSRFPQQGAPLQYVGRDGNTFVYRVPGASRVRFVPAARYVASDAEAGTRLLDGAFDPDAEVLLHDATPPSAGGNATAAVAGRGSASITHETQRDLAIAVDAPRDGFLLLADTFYPGWSARIDGTPTAVIRANLSVRAVQVPAGRHEVRFTYEAPGVSAGLRITVVAVGLLLLWTAAAGYVVVRDRRYRSNPMAPQNPITT